VKTHVTKLDGSKGAIGQPYVSLKLSNSNPKQQAKQIQSMIEMLKRKRLSKIIKIDN